MKSVFLTLSVMLVFLLTPLLASAQNYQNVQGPPPVSQPLVREGTVAMQLVVALKAGSPAGEAEAESTLTSLGIAPRNGWMADYPVTPDIVAELNTAITSSADAGALSLNREEALQAFEGVLTGDSIDVSTAGPTDTGNIPPGEGYPDSAVVSNYYYDQGPPVVTYYAPPPDYSYLYTWVPYPFWWWSFWFPGFYVMTDFDIVVYDHHHGYGHDHHEGHYHGHHHEGYGGHSESVSNHYRDHGTGRMFRINPAARATGGTLADRGISRRWTSSGAERSARAIYNRSLGTVTRQGSGAYVPSRSNAARSLSSRDPSAYTGRSANSYAPDRRTYYGSSTYGRSSFHPAYTSPRSVTRSYTAPSPAYESRSYSRPAYRTPSVERRAFASPSFQPRTYSTPSRSFSAPSRSFNSFGAPSRGGFSSGEGFRGSFGSGGSSFGRAMRR